MRVVLDTNVIVSAFRSQHGASNAILRMADQGLFTPLCSTALFLEYEAVLSRPAVRLHTQHSLETVAAVLAALAALCRGVDIKFRTRPLLKDAADEMVLETAVNGQASVIVTHNVRDFTPAQTLGVLVETPGMFLKRLQNDSDAKI